MAEVTTTVEAEEPVLWRTYVSWNQFAWLYFASLFTALRGALLWQAAMPGWQTWGIGAGALVALAVLLRYWVRYEATSQRLLIRNALTGREIRAAPWQHVNEITVKQGLIAWSLGIGTLVFRSTHGDDVMEFRGVSDPASTLQHIQTVRRQRIFPGS